MNGKLNNYNTELKTCNSDEETEEAVGGYNLEDTLRLRERTSHVFDYFAENKTNKKENQEKSQEYHVVFIKKTFEADKHETGAVRTLKTERSLHPLSFKADNISEEEKLIITHKILEEEELLRIRGKGNFLERIFKLGEKYGVNIGAEIKEKMEDQIECQKIVSGQLERLEQRHQEIVSEQLKRTERRREQQLYMDSFVEETKNSAYDMSNYDFIPIKSSGRKLITMSGDRKLIKMKSTEEIKQDIVNILREKKCTKSEYDKLNETAFDFAIKMSLGGEGVTKEMEENFQMEYKKCLEGSLDSQMTHNKCLESNLNKGGE